MSDGGRRASVRCPPLRITRKNEPAVLGPGLHETRRHIGGGALVVDRRAAPSCRARPSKHRFFGGDEHLLDRARGEGDRTRRFADALVGNHLPELDLGNRGGCGNEGERYGRANGSDPSCQIVRMPSRCGTATSVQMSRSRVLRRNLRRNLRLVGGGGPHKCLAR
jgi:hypothetical protein